MTPKKDWYVYLLRCADETLYCGVTVDPDRRLSQHNAGTASKYTRSRRPVVMAACARVADKSTALRMEAAIKKLPRREKLARLAMLADTNG
ncbi:GIY-YIG nuclease family protein [Pseudodesulfovibrio tunisiensis]|uniref:GIY-YIG nuclease family protein n=1 Tax=Pseudodesulfovibrio tunisiensis TaxID=463192 RepID=UPI001FB55CF5|nr:GIY-YIG nuclease family protein [Pseudodesulfovibrio tunisiensis]